jgi:hypothetical protein
LETMRANSSSSGQVSSICRCNRWCGDSVWVECGWMVWALVVEEEEEEEVVAEAETKMEGTGVEGAGGETMEGVKGPGPLKLTLLMLLLLLALLLLLTMGTGEREMLLERCGERLRMKPLK